MMKVNEGSNCDGSNWLSETRPRWRRPERAHPRRAMSLFLLSPASACTTRLSPRAERIAFHSMQILAVADSAYQT
jgi:hypothetical protein